MTSLSWNSAVVETAMAQSGSAAFGLGSGSIIGSSDLYRPLGLLPGGAHYLQRPVPTSTTAAPRCLAPAADEWKSTTATPPPTAEFHRHRSPFAIQQLLGLGQDEKPANDPLMSARSEDFASLNADKTADYRNCRDKLR